MLTLILEGWFLCGTFISSVWKSTDSIHFSLPDHFAQHSSSAVANQIKSVVWYKNWYSAHDFQRFFGQCSTMDHSQHAVDFLLLFTISKNFTHLWQYEYEYVTNNVLAFIQTSVLYSYFKQSQFVECRTFVGHNNWYLL